MHNSNVPRFPFKFPPKFEKGEKIGEGTYGLVYHARSKENGGRFALKQFKSQREGEGVSPTAIREIMLLRELNHENIVRLDSVHINRAEPSLWLAFDYADHDLFEMIRYHRENRESRKDNPTGLMPHHVIKSTMWQLLNGLNYLHQHWVLHRDLKPSNVLVAGDDAGPDQHGRVKIADFGLARIFQAPCRPLSDNGVVVTIWYRSPELLLGGKHYTRAVDVWAAACIFAELCMLRPLFQGQERKTPGNAFQADQLERIFSVLGHPSVCMKNWDGLEALHHWHDNTDNVRVRKDSHPSQAVLGATMCDAMRQNLPMWCQGQIPGECAVPQEALHLLARMLDYNPNTRITAEEALAHPYFTQCEPKPAANVFALPYEPKPAANVFALPCEFKPAANMITLPCEPKLAANVFALPGARDNTVRYTKRAVTYTRDHPAGGAGGQGGGAGGGGGVLPPPSRGRDGVSLPPGMRPSGMLNAGGGQRKRKAEAGQAALSGFR
ncbi:hypothetical protein FOA52_015881 [Chlamydomonas sp. UWO 241]|nr:hypothetical protein FOA52_015881 [Chlamydomonas sp. UWO 241]